MKVSKDGRCKISDFGLSRLKPEQSGNMTQNAGTITYMAPEVIVEGRYNEKADVYSYGILLCELFQGKSPYHHIQYEWNYQFMRRFASKEIEPQLPSQEECPYPELVDLIKQCIKWDFKERPSFENILDFHSFARNVL